MQNRAILLAVVILSSSFGCTKTEDEQQPAAKPSAPAEPPAKTAQPAKATIKLSAKPEAVAEFEKGRDLVEKARAPEGVEHFKKAVELDPDFALAHAMLAMESGGDPAAMKSMEAATAAAAKASEPERLWVEAIGHIVAGRPTEALASLRKVTAAVPGDWHAWLALGVIAQNNHLYPEATSAFGKVRDAAPELPMAWNGLAYTNAFQQKNDDAIAAAKKQVELLPNEPNPQDTLGEILLMAGKFEDAEAAFQKALEINADFGIAWQGIAFSRAYRGDFKGAHEAIAKGKAMPKLRPGDRAEASLDDAWITFAEGNTAAALAAVDAVAKDPALKDMPQAIWAAFDRAQMQLWAGKPKDAEKSLADVEARVKATTLPQKDMFAMWLNAAKAMVSAKAGQPDAAAIAAFEADAQKRPDDFRTQQTLLIVHGLAAGAKDPKAGIPELAKCAPDNLQCHYERLQALKKANDKMGADLAAKQIASMPLRNASSLWIRKQAAAK